MVLDLEPNATNPRNSEGAFITLKSGRLAFYYTQFYGGLRDFSDARIVKIHSDDDGRTWSEPTVVFEKGGAQNIMSVSLLRLQSGKLALFYLVKNSGLDCGPFLSFSDDEGVTWSTPARVIEAPGYFVLNNDRVIQLSTGRLVFSVAFNRLLQRKTGEKLGETKRLNDSRGIALWFYSDDEGSTWKEARSWWAMNQPSDHGLQEPGVVELADGSLFAWARTDQGSQFEFRSKDRGATWTPPQPGPLMSPLSPASIKRLPNSTALLSIYNDHSGRYTFPPQRRSPLVAAISEDGGRSWPRSKIVESDPEGWYCYTAIHFTRDAVLLAYCAGDEKVGRLARLRIRRIDLSWLP